MEFTPPNLCQQYQAALLLSAQSTPGKEVSRVFCTNDKYEVKLDLQFFKPEEISVKAVDRFIVVEGRHEKKEEKLGLISHQMTRKYVLPEGVEPENVACTLGDDGILTLSAPRNLNKAPAKEVSIPIQKDEATGTSDKIKR